MARSRTIPGVCEVTAHIPNFVQTYSGHHIRWRSAQLNHPHRSHQTDWSRRRRPLRPPHNQDLLQSRSVGTHHRHTDQTLRSSQILRLKTRLCVLLNVVGLTLVDSVVFDH